MSMACHRSSAPSVFSGRAVGKTAGGGRVELAVLRGRAGDGVLPDVHYDLLKYAKEAGVGHYVALSVVGTDRLQASALVGRVGVLPTLVATLARWK